MSRRRRLLQQSVPLRALLGLVVAAAVLGAAELALRSRLGTPPPGTWEVATGWAGCFFEDLGDSFTLCNAEGHSPRQVFPLTSEATRVAVVGGSSVFGGTGPEDVYFAELLDAALPELELINVGLPGTNSLGVAERVAALVDLDVDGFVIYTGHNDVAGRVFGGAAEHVVLRSRIAARLERLWLYRLLERALALGSPGRAEGAMELVDRTDWEGELPVWVPLYSAQELAAVADDVQDNLRRAVAAADGRPVVLVTPLGNPLAPPIATAPGPVPQLTGDCAADRAATSAPTTAAVAWVGVQAAHRCGDPAWLLQAADDVTRLDALPVRATPEVRQAVRAAAAESGAALVDLEALLPLELRAGDALFHDTLHLSRRGHQEVAGSVAPVLSQAMTRP